MDNLVTIFEFNEVNKMSRNIFQNRAYSTYCLFFNCLDKLWNKPNRSHSSHSSYLSSFPPFVIYSSIYSPTILPIFSFTNQKFSLQCGIMIANLFCLWNSLPQFNAWSFLTLKLLWLYFIFLEGMALLSLGMVCTNNVRKIWDYLS